MMIMIMMLMTMMIPEIQAVLAVEPTRSVLFPTGQVAHDEPET